MGKAKKTTSKKSEAGMVHMLDAFACAGIERGIRAILLEHLGRRHRDLVIVVTSRKDTIEIGLDGVDALVERGWAAIATHVSQAAAP